MALSSLSKLLVAIILLHLAGDTWAEPAGDVASLPFGLSDMTVTVTAADELVVMGGCNGTQFYNDSGPYPGYYCTSVADVVLAFNPALDVEWRVLGRMPRPRYRHCAGLLAGFIVVAGGRTLEDDLVTEVDMFEVATGQWQTLATGMPEGATVSDAAAFVLGDPEDPKFYMVGGYTANYAATNWTQVLNMSGDGTWFRVADMLEARGDAAAAVLRSAAYVGGGFTHENSFEAPLETVEVYDAVTDQWQQRASLGLGRGDKVLATLNGRLHAVGGEGKATGGTHSVPVEEVEVYDPQQDRWTVLGEVPGGERFRFGGAVVGDRLYLVGGQGPLQGPLNTVGSYYPLLRLVQSYTDPDIAGPSSNDGSRRTVVIAAVVGSLVALAIVSAIVLLAFRRLFGQPSIGDQLPLALDEYPSATVHSISSEA